MALAAGADAGRISYGNTIKKEADIARRLRAGVRLFAFDSEAELEKIARAGAGRRVFCRILTTRRGRRLAAVAQVRLRARHGARAADAAPLRWASSPGASRSMSARSRRTRTPGRRRWPRPRACSATSRRSASSSAWSISAAASRRATATAVPDAAAYGVEIMAAVRRHFGNRLPFLIAEPGRGLVGNAGVIQTEVVLIADKGDGDDRPLGLSRHRQVRRPRRDRWTRRSSTRSSATATGAPMPVILAGPTCDSADVLYERSALQPAA